MPTVMELDPQKDSAAYDFLPIPPECELQLVASNCLVWARYDERQRGRAHTCDTIVYEQKAVAQRPTRIIKFIGRKMPEVVGVSGLGSLLFDRGEEYRVAGDVPVPNSQFFLSDTRSNCLFELKVTISPSGYMERVWREERVEFTFPVLKRSVPQTAREIQVSTVRPGYLRGLYVGHLPSPEWIRNLWPIVAFDDKGFTIWNGAEWMKFEWDAKNATDDVRQPADSSPKPSS